MGFVHKMSQVASGLHFNDLFLPDSCFLPPFLNNLANGFSGSLFLGEPSL